MHCLPYLVSLRISSAYLWFLSYSVLFSRPYKHFFLQTTTFWEIYQTFDKTISEFTLCTLAFVYGIPETRLMAMPRSILRVGCVKLEPYANECPTYWSRPGKGLSYDLLRNLWEMFLYRNYSIQIVQANDYGSQDANGTWNGLIGQLVRHRIDVAIVQLYYTAERSTILTNVMPFLQRQPFAVLFNPHDPTPTIPFFDPFQWQVWVCWILAFLLIVKVAQISSRTQLRFFSQAYNVSFRQRSA